jgi:hypothetical protein
MVLASSAGAMPAITPKESSAAPPATFRSSLPFVIFVAVCAAVIALRFLRLSANSLLFPFPLDYGEGAILDGVLRLARFENIYRVHVSGPPWFVTNYPPVYYLLNLPFMWAFGPGLWYGRLISQASSVGTAVLLFVILRRLTGDTRAALASGAVFLTIPFVVAWAQYDRVDLVALALNWAGVWIVVRRQESNLTVAALLFVASGFTRQTGPIVGLAASTAWLLSEQRSRDAVRLVVFTAVGAAALFAVLTVLSRGGFAFNVVTGTAGRLIRSQLMALGAEAVDVMPLLLIAALVAVVARVFVPAVGWTLIVTAVVTSFGLALLVAKEGSYINYFLDLCAASSLAFGAIMAWARPWRSLVALMLLLMALQVIGMGRTTVLYAHLRERLARGREYTSIANTVRSTSGTLLADEAMALLPLQGRPLVFHPFAMTQLANRRRWDESDFVATISERRYPILLLRMPGTSLTPLSNLWTERMSDAIVGNYDIVQRVPVDGSAAIAIWRPKRDGR